MSLRLVELDKVARGGVIHTYHFNMLRTVSRRLHSSMATATSDAASSETMRTRTGFCISDSSI